MRQILVGTAVALLVVAPLVAAKGNPTREEAMKRLQADQRSLNGDGLLDVLEYRNDSTVDLVKAYLAIGIAANKPITFRTDDGQTLSAYPLNYMLRRVCDDPRTAEITKIFIDAGADVSAPDAGDYGRTPAIAAVRCPDVLALILAKKPDLTIRDEGGFDVMHHAIHEAEPPAPTVKMLLDAGYDPKPHLKELRDDARGMPEVLALLTGKPAAAPPAATTTGGAIDWKSLPPYPSRTGAQAKKALSRPGADTTVQEHFWDAITGREPLRLALALAAGANVRDTRSVTGYTPLVLLAERCDATDDADQQSAIAQMLIDAGADLSGVDANRANALTMAAHSCPIGVVQALIKGGLPLSAVSSTGDTPLRAAIMADRADVVAALLAAGVDPKKEPYNARKLASSNPAITALLKGKK